ncbi:pantoate--beta-alanine ligase [Allosphingosinicella flava]|uniref:Pantothenate synthetase n=1 Tax=Allosphingosinicella flava TaxID=2771430 RepID=A0A7T2GIQ9_9SPHN|nr:pantoate--beta-alanine ligase [Sphingosinicella flava]QPQ54589.1 pantoate--beta-alanine ligase [Sphingosinicella flava]
MQTLRDLPALRAALGALRTEGGKIAFVPTMGALHAGHMALIAEARRRARFVIASVFVNPTQFGPNEDFSRYPRQEARDAALLEENGCTLLWAPSVEVMYPGGPEMATRITVSGVSEGLCGASRPGHFDGVATVVAKLLNQVQPDFALFGEKDYQQLAVIRRMAADLDLAVEIAGVPTQRDADGLALSSRNAYLSPEERVAARALPRALGRAAAALQAGEEVDAVLAAARAALADAGFASVDYVELRDADTLVPLAALDRPARLLAAARMGATRLIDNLPVLPAGKA